MKTEQTNIEWAHYTFNPWRGCTKVSEGCAHCYAEVLSRRNPATLGEWGPGQPRVLAADAMWRSPLRWNATQHWRCPACGTVTAKNSPTGWQCDCTSGSTVCELIRPRVFCASFADVFDPEVPTEGRQRLLSLIDATPNLDWLLLTKRPEQIEPLMQAAMHGNFEPSKTFAEHMPHVWLGTSVENQRRAAERVSILCDIPAAVHFLSCEPLLGPVNLRAIDDDDGNSFDALTGAWSIEGRGWTEPDPRRAIGWVIVGGESGGSARPMHPRWAQSLLFQCRSADVPFFFKQWGEFSPPDNPGLATLDPKKKLRGHRFPDGQLVLRAGKKVAGRELDGREWNQFPAVHGKEVVCG